MKDREWGGCRVRVDVVNNIKVNCHASLKWVLYLYVLCLVEALSARSVFPRILFVSFYRVECNTASTVLNVTTRPPK